MTKTEEIKQIKSIIKQNLEFAERVENMKLMVQSSSGEEIPVNRDTLVEFNDNNSILETRLFLLESELDECGEDENDEWEEEWEDD